MKNDIKTKSTDFLPQKPGLSTSPTDGAAIATPQPTTLAASDLPPGAPAPSKHVIDLKNASNTDSSSEPSSVDQSVKNNPFLQGKKAPEDLKVEPAPMPAPAEPAKSDVVSSDVADKVTVATSTDQVTDDTKKAEPGTTPSMDLAHPESDQQGAEKDSLKDAMVSDDATAKKPKKKLPTWLMVIIIVVAVVLIGIITFVVLNAVAKPTGV